MLLALSWCTRQREICPRVIILIIGTIQMTVIAVVTGKSDTIRALIATSGCAQCCWTLTCILAFNSACSAVEDLMRIRCWPSISQRISSGLLAVRLWVAAGATHRWEVVQNSRLLY
jgi:hypothetical protein